MRKNKWNVENKVNNKSAITNMSLSEFFMGNATSESNSITLSNVLEKDPTFSACISFLANNLASMGIDLYQTISDRDKVKVSNELSDMLKHAPNKNDTGIMLLRKMWTNYFLHGQAVIYIKTKRGVPCKLEVLNPSDTIITRIDRTDTFVVESTLYDKPFKKLSDEFIIIEDTTQRFKSVKPILEAKYKGIGMIESFFSSKGGNVKGILSTTSDLSNEAKKVLKKSFTDILSQDGNNIAVLDSGLEYKNIYQDVSLRESMVNELCVELDNQIFAIMGCPKALVLGDSKESSYNAMTVILNSFIKSLQPHIQIFEAEMMKKLLTQEERSKGFYFKVNANKIMRMTPIERMDFYKTAIQTGIMSIAEARELEDLPFVENTEDLLLSLNYVPLSRYDTYLDSRYGTNKEGGVNNE